MKAASKEMKSGIELVMSWVLFLSLAVVLTLSGLEPALAQGVAINEDGASPNANAALDVKSPATGAGKGLLIPRITEAQRTTADINLAGGLLDDSGNLRGGAAQGLMVYQTDGTEGFYYNASATSTPSWKFIKVDGLGNFLADGTVAMTSSLDMGTQKIINVSTAIEFSGADTAIGNTANGGTSGTAVGSSANGSTYGVATGYQANGNSYGVAAGYQANGYDLGAAVGYRANAFTGTGTNAGGVAVGYMANTYSGNGAYCGGVAVGHMANARHNMNQNMSGAVAVGFMANAFPKGAAVGFKADGYNEGVALGYKAFGYSQGTAVGFYANAYAGGTAIGYCANSGNQYWSFAKGPFSRCTRYNEEWKGTDSLTPVYDTTYDDFIKSYSGYNKFGYGQVDWCGQTANNVATELFLGGTASKRFVLQDNSALTFTVHVVAVNTSTGDSSSWIFSGGIKRRAGAATTELIGAISTQLSQVQGTLSTSPALTADTTNGGLKLVVTGVIAATVKWNAMMSYSEVRE